MTERRRVSAHEIAATVDYQFKGNALSEGEKRALAESGIAFDIVDAQQFESTFERQEGSHSTGHFWCFWIAFDSSPGTRVLMMDEKEEVKELYGAIHTNVVGGELISGPWMLQYVKPKTGNGFYSLVPGNTSPTRLTETDREALPF